MQCDVTDMQGNHCPETPTHTMNFKGVEVHLCEKCYVNVLSGAYGKISLTVNDVGRKPERNKL